jgi:ABC-2 type transport system ATP-binding protein
MIGELTLGRWADRRSRVLSLGNRQRLGLACALVHRPRLLILDEPTNGLDPMGVLELRRMLLSRSHGDGVGVLVSSHHLDEVARVADRITVMHRGRVIGNLDPGGVDLEHRFLDVCSYCFLSDCQGWNSACSGAGGSMRSPFRRPVRT